MERDIQKILIIDDDSRNIFALSAILKSRRYECVTAANGHDGLRQLKEKSGISMALIDMMMPGMDGYQVIKLIREDPVLSDLPLVAVTAQAMVGDKERCLEAGADAYISKPVNIDILLKVMNELSNNKA